MTLVFATHNTNKFTEVKRLMPEHIQLVTLKAIGCNDEIPETGKTLTENAIIKSTFVSKTYGLPCFSDDTGLMVDALDDEPGVYSARYAGPEKRADANMKKLLQNLEGHTNRAARFETVIALNLNSEDHIFKGVVHGEIIAEPRGEKGFGYDPIFVPEGYAHTFAELSMAEKGKISHRGRAISALVDFLRFLPSGN